MHTYYNYYLIVKREIFPPKQYFEITQIDTTHSPQKRKREERELEEEELNFKSHINTCKYYKYVLVNVAK